MQSSFYVWLMTQHDRHDAVGHLARHARSTSSFPRQSSRLYVLLRWVGDIDSRLRDGIKLAHAEWRAVR